MDNSCDFIQAVSAIPGVSVHGNTVTVRPRKQEQPPKLRVNRNGKGYATSYTFSIGCAEARRVGFIDESGTPLPLEKLVDESAHTITIRLKKPDNE